ncbi:MAG: hypothetical protein NTX49_07260 [Chlamydiae bacterium]|nr:hypothetical protein [Chlamydiota bacterium]
MRLPKLYDAIRNVLSSKDHKAPIEIFVRHCHFSDVSAHKKRPKGFSREKCHKNFLSSIEGQPGVNVTFFLDTFYPMEKRHFILDQDLYPVVQMSEGREGGSFCFMLEYVLSRKFSPDTIIYFLEDDYLHRNGWVDVLREGIDLLGIDYVTLYDHRDKYFLESYKGLKLELFLSKSAHFRTTPSTTNTYAMKFATLQRDKEIHFAFSRGKKITEDHAKFLNLSAKGARLISPIPGWSCHMEPEYMSPCIDWDCLLQEEITTPIIC